MKQFNFGEYILEVDCNGLDYWFTLQGKQDGKYYSLQEAGMPYKTRKWFDVHNKVIELLLEFDYTNATAHADSLQLELNNIVNTPGFTYTREPKQ